VSNSSLPTQISTLSLHDALPISSFRAGLSELKTHKYFKRYPAFWQVFLWGFGGFYLKDRQAQEFAWLAEDTGIPPDEIPNALKRSEEHTSESSHQIISYAVFCLK